MKKDDKDEIEILESQASLYDLINRKMRDMAKRNQDQLTNLMVSPVEYLRNRLTELSQHSQEINVHDENESQSDDK
jgi:hypothetical protein